MALDARIGVLLSFTTLFLLGIPVWWKTTEVYRSELPHQFIEEWMSDKDTLMNEDYSKIHVKCVFLDENSVDVHLSEEKLRNFQDDITSSLKEVNQEYTNFYSIQTSHKQTPNLKDVGTLHPQGIDEWLLKNPESSFENGKYTLYVLMTSTGGNEGELIVGKYRHAWVRISPSNLVKLWPSIAKKIANTLAIHFTPHGSSIGDTSVDKLVAVTPASSYRISFSLMNADPSNVVPSWDIQGALARYLNPLLFTLDTLADFTVDSQILHYTTLLQSPLYDADNKCYYLKSSSLPQFIDPAEWKLDLTDSTTQPLLNFILFVPAANESPLKIAVEDGTYSTTNAFVVPQWGGIYIHNFKNSHQLSVDDLQIPFQIFVTQLRELLGLAPLAKNEYCTILPSPTTGIAQWEVDQLVRRYLYYNINATVATLHSLSSLVQNLTNMVVKDNIAEMCSASLFSLARARHALARRNLKEAHIASKAAYKYAEEAFFDPTMLSMLYFPDEHKYAVYALPFFPVTFQLLSGIIGEINSRRKIWQQRQEKKKKE